MDPSQTASPAGFSSPPGWKRDRIDPDEVRLDAERLRLTDRLLRWKERRRRRDLRAEAWKYTYYTTGACSAVAASWATFTAVNSDAPFAEPRILLPAAALGALVSFLPFKRRRTQNEQEKNELDTLINDVQTDVARMEDDRRCARPAEIQDFRHRVDQYTDRYEKIVSKYDSAWAGDAKSRAGQVSG